MAESAYLGFLIANVIKWTAIDEVPPPYSIYDIRVHTKSFFIKVDRESSNTVEPARLEERKT
jgi:hypothetical protein